MIYQEYNEDFGRNEFGTQMDNEAAKYSALQSLLAGKQLEQDEVASLREFKVVQQFLDTPVGDPSEAKLKKVFAAAIIAANDQGTLPFSLEDKSAIAIASAVDEGLNRVKLSYKLATEELDAIEVADAMIDATAARVVKVADKVIERGVPVLLDKVCEIIPKIYPPASVFVPVIKQAERYLVPAAKVAVRKGMTWVAEKAKTTVRSVVKKVKNVAKRISVFLKG